METEESAQMHGGLHVEYGCAQKCRRHCMQIYDHAADRNIFIDAIWNATEMWCDVRLAFDFSSAHRTRYTHVRLRRNTKSSRRIQLTMPFRWQRTTTTTLAIWSGWKVVVWLHWLLHLQIRIDLCTRILYDSVHRVLRSRAYGKWLKMHRWHAFERGRMQYATNGRWDDRKLGRLCWCLISIGMDLPGNPIIK